MVLRRCQYVVAADQWPHDDRDRLHLRWKLPSGCAYPSRPAAPPAGVLQAPKTLLRPSSLVQRHLPAAARVRESRGPALRSNKAADSAAGPESSTGQLCAWYTERKVERPSVSSVAAAQSCFPSFFFVFLQPTTTLENPRHRNSRATPTSMTSASTFRANSCAIVVPTTSAA